MSDAVGYARASLASRVSVIAITATLYALAKGVTGYIPSPWGVGQLFIGGFAIAFMAIIAETVPVAIGTGLGTFIGDVLFLAPAGNTNAALSLVAGVPGNVIAILFFGYFVKRYKSWPAFIAATVSFFTFGNLFVAASVVLVGANLFVGVSFLLTKFYAVGLIFGFTAFWSLTTIPVTIIVVPLLIRAVAPLRGRSAVIQNIPSWSTGRPKVPLLLAITLALVPFLAVLLYLPAAFTLSGGGLASFSGIALDSFLFAIAMVIIVPIAGVVVGSASRGFRSS